MLLFSLPYVVLATILLILTPKVVSENFLIALNFTLSILSILHWILISLWVTLAWYAGYIYEVLALLNRICTNTVDLNILFLLFVIFPPVLFLFRKLRSSKKYCLFVIFLAFLGVTKCEFDVSMFFAGWHTFTFPLIEDWIIKGFATMVLSLSSILLVNLKVLPEFRKNYQRNILDLID